LSGAAGSAVAPWATKASFGAGLVISSVAGGLASVAGGGKFANGAVTAGFGYLFNATMHLGVSVSMPALFAQGLTSAYQYLTGDQSFVMGNSVGGGIVIQYPGVSEHSADVPYDAGIYGTAAAPAGELGPVLN
jgi:hypothetical protein